MQDNYSPPSVPSPPPLHTYTYATAVPTMDEEDAEFILGIDEAGRGPILGPMVYSLAYCSAKFNDEHLPTCEFADSKKLTESKRWELMKRISTDTDLLNSQLGYAITSLTATDISSSMLRPSTSIVNLNEQAHDASINLIKLVISKLKSKYPTVKIKALYIDTVGTPATYVKKLRTFFSTSDIEVIKVEKKADATYPIVSAASVVAKVTRDWYLKQQMLKLGIDDFNWGSGYPGDPNTIKFINSRMHPWFGWDHNVRYSWSTAKNALEKNRAVEIRWEHELVKKHGYQDILELAKPSSITPHKFEVSKDWFL